MDGESENAGQLSDRCFALSGKVLSFGYFSLHQQRKVTRRQAKAPGRPQGVGFWSHKNTNTNTKIKIKIVSRYRASSFLLLAQKKRTKEKGPPRQTASASVPLRRHFRTRHPWLGPKTAAIHGGRPPGVQKASTIHAT